MWHSLQPRKPQPKFIYSKHHQEEKMQYESRDFKVASVVSIYGLAPLSPPPASQILSFLKIGNLLFPLNFYRLAQCLTQISFQ